jgi:hypothetical protein
VPSATGKRGVAVAVGVNVGSGVEVSVGVKVIVAVGETATVALGCTDGPEPHAARRVI